MWVEGGTFIENKLYCKSNGSLNFLKEKAGHGEKNVSENSKKTYAPLKVMLDCSTCLHSYNTT